MLKEQLLMLVDEKEKLFFELSNTNDSKEKEIIYNKIQKIDSTLYKYRNSLEEIPIQEGNKVDLYRYILNGEGTYAVCIHETNEIIGSVQYRGEIKLHRDTLGNIGYETYMDYRRKGYMLEALTLLGKYLYNKGVEKIYISTRKNNIPSIKLVEKFGGKIIKKYSNSYNVYECDLRVINKTKEIKSCKR